MEYLILFIVLGFLYLLFKPSRKLKTKAQKQAEILQSYKDRLDKELDTYVDDRALHVKKKTELLKEFASELNRNMFFDEKEVRVLIQKLVNYGK